MKDLERRQEKIIQDNKNQILEMQRHIFLEMVARHGLDMCIRDLHRISREWAEEFYHLSEEQEQ
jgi:hypothetical protein